MLTAEAYRLIRRDYENFSGLLASGSCTEIASSELKRLETLFPLVREFEASWPAEEVCREDAVRDDMLVEWKKAINLERERHRLRLILSGRNHECIL